MTRSSAAPLEAVGRSDTGMIRPKNEDALLCRPDLGLVAVADGMGGAPAGDVASALAVEALEECFNEGHPATTERMARAFEAAHDRILREQESRPERRGMGTTLTAVALDPSSRRFILGHVGDSRAYRLGGRGLELLSRDHTWVQEEVERGRLSPEAARNHPAGHILTRVLGVGDGARPDVEEGTLGPDDLLLLCTDGLTAVLDEEEIEEVLEEAPASENGLERPVDDLVERGHRNGSPDNLTVVLARWRRAP